MPTDSNDAVDVHSSRHNGLRATIEDAERDAAVLDDTYTPAMVEIYGDLGFDFVWQIWKTPGRPRETLGRVRTCFGRPTPRASTRSFGSPNRTRRRSTRCSIPAAETSSSRTSRRPRRSDERSKRPAFRTTARPARGFCEPGCEPLGQAEEYLATEDREITVGVTIEEPRAVERIDEILSVPDLGFVFVGPFDLSVAMGHPGEISYPEVEASVERVVATTRDTDVALGGLGFDAHDVVQKIDQGYQLLHVGSTTAAAIDSLGSWPARFDDR